MSRNPIRTDKLIRHDQDLEVPFAFLGAFVSCVQVALILDQELGRSQRVLQALPNHCNSFFAHMSTSLKGITVVCANSPASE